MTNIGGYLNTISKRVVNFFHDVEDAGLPTQDNYQQTLIRKYLEGELQSPILATTRRPAYRAIVSPTPGGTDFTDLQKAIDFVNELGGGTVFVKMGTYYPTTNINLYSNIELVGEDSSTTIIDFNGGDFKILASGGTPRMNNINIKSIKVMGARPKQYGAITIRYADDCSVEDCHFEDNVGTSTHIIGASNKTPLAGSSIGLRKTTGGYTILSQGFKLTKADEIIQAYLHLKLNGSFAEETYNIWVEIQGDDGTGKPTGTALFTSLNRDPAGIDTSGDWEIFEEILSDPFTIGTQYHLVLKGDYPASDVNYIQWNNSAASGNTYADGAPYGNSGSWVSTEQDDFNFQIDLNPIDSIQSHDIYLDNCNRVLIQRNYSYQSAFIVNYYGVHNRIYDNYIDGSSANNPTNTLHIWISHSTKTMVMRNAIIGATYAAINHDNASSNGFYAYNYIEDFGSLGIYMNAGDYNFVCNNFILHTTTGGTGISAYATKKSTITGNICVNCTYSGIATSQYDSVCNNVCIGCNKGIYVSSTYNSVMGNVCYGNTTGIYVDSGTGKHEIIGNQLTGNTTALDDDSSASDVAHNMVA
jgi:parallel beta-helix repeat protein